jgi:hypothetical protein
MKIWCLFSVDNNYDQPEHNLVCWWQQKPTLECLAEILVGGLGKAHDDQIVGVVGIWTGNDDRVPGDDTAYRLEEVNEGVRLNAVA